MKQRPIPEGVAREFGGFLVGEDVTRMCYGRMSAPPPVFDWADAVCALGALDIASLQLMAVRAVGGGAFGSAVGALLVLPVETGGLLGLPVDMATELIRIVVGGEASPAEVSDIFRQIFERPSA